MPASNQENHEEKKFWVTLPPYTGSMTLVGVILMILLISALVVVTGIIQISSIGEKLNQNFIQSNKEILLTVQETATLAAESDRYSSLIRTMQKIQSHQQQAGHTNSVKDIFFLKRNGELAAHNDITQLTIHAKSRISKINSPYNNELFHQNLLGDAGTIYTSVYPYDTYNKNRKYLYFFRRVLPENYFATMDFTLPIYANKKSAGTLHLVATRELIDTILEEQLRTLSFIWMGGLFAGFLVMLILHVFVAQKVNEHEKIITAIEIPILREHQLEDEKRLIDERLNALSSLPGQWSTTFTDERGSIRPNKPVKNAILIKSE